MNAATKLSDNNSAIVFLGTKAINTVVTNVWQMNGVFTGIITNETFGLKLAVISENGSIWKTSGNKIHG
jgi:hypothetical protein